jgi:hypothetical protein
MRTKRAQRHRQAPPKPAPTGLPDPFGAAWPEIVEREEQDQRYEEEACPCCVDRQWELFYSKLGDEYTRDLYPFDPEEYDRFLRDDRERSWDHLWPDDLSRDDSRPDLDFGDYDDWRRAFPELPW